MKKKIDLDYILEMWWLCLFLPDVAFSIAFLYSLTQDWYIVKEIKTIKGATSITTSMSTVWGLNIFKVIATILGIFVILNIIVYVILYLINQRRNK